MTKLGLLASAAMVTLAALTGQAAAGSLACRSINGNVVCAGPGGTSCQTVDGRTECVSATGDVRQSFGGPTGEVPETPDAEGAEAEAPDATAESAPMPRRLVERPGPGGRAISVVRDGRRLRVENGRTVIEIN